VQKIIFIIFILSLNACAVVHHVQVGDIDDRSESERFEIIVSQTGVNLSQATRIASSVTPSKSHSKDLRQLSELIKFFQMGPSTGLGVFNEKYAEQLLELISDVCPNGKISGLTSIREMRKYPVISGEIVKVNGYCHKNIQRN